MLALPAGERIVIEIKKGRALELSGHSCALCNRPSTYVAWVIGRPLMQVCMIHRKAVREMWVGALDAEEKAA